MKTLLLASLVTLCATTASLAQSMTNFGPNAPAYGDSYGQPPSGTYPPLQKRGYASYAYSPYWHHHPIITAIGTIDIGTGGNSWWTTASMPRQKSKEGNRGDR